ncbi:MAG TPA: ABC transporter permease, partial [Longimicrobium sp.]
LAYQLRRVSTGLCIAVPPAFAFLAGRSTPEAGEWLDSPFGITWVTVLGGAIWLLVAPALAGEAAARDVHTGMHPLTYTAPVSRAEYLGGRFLAAFVLNALIQLTVPLGLLLAVSLPGVPIEYLGPFRPTAYFTAYGLIALPFTFAATAVQFSRALQNRRTGASYLPSVLLFIGCTFLLPGAAQLLGRRELVRLLDVVGIAGLVLGPGGTWTQTEQNTRLVALEGALLANRLLWLAIGAGVLASAWFRFRLVHHTESPRRGLVRRRQNARPARGELQPAARIVVPRVRREFGAAASARQTAAIARDSFESIAKGQGGLVLLGIMAMLVVAVVPVNLESFGVPLLPRAGYVLTFLTAPLTHPFTAWAITPMLIAMYAGELVWRERGAGLGDIADAAPVPTWALFAGKFLGLALVLAVWMALLTLAGVLVQLRMGYGGFEPGLFLLVHFGLQLPEYLLFALLALVVQGVANHKYAGHLASLAAYGFIAFAARLGVENHLLVYGSSPAWSYTDIRGFGPSLGPWLWLKLYWAAWALLLAVAARVLWARGREAGPRARIRRARQRFTKPTAIAATAGVSLVVSLGGFIYYNTNVLNEDSTARGFEVRAEYERRY